MKKIVLVLAVVHLENFYTLTTQKSLYIMVDTLYIRDCKCYKPTQCYGGCSSIRCKQLNQIEDRPGNPLSFWAEQINWKRNTDDDE